MLTLFIAQILCFQEAVDLTLENSPQLKIQADLIGQRVGDHTQASMRPNPIFTYTVENVLGTREWRGWRDAKEEYDLTQTIETAGKRRYRTLAACHAVDEAEERLELVRLTILNQLKKQFIETAGFQESLSVARERAANAEEILKTLQQEIEQGKGNPIQFQKIKVQLANALFDQERVQGDLQQAKEALALMWGASYPEFEKVSYDLYNLESPCSDCETNVEGHPLLLQWESRRRSLEQVVNLEKAIATPDFLFTVGYKTEDRNRGLVFSLAVPLPFFDRNQGNILRAEFDEQSTITELTAHQTRLQTLLRTSTKEVLRNFKEAIFLRDHILKAAQDAYDLSLEGYKQGKYGLLDVLESHQTLFDIQEKYIAILVETHISQVDVEYLAPPNPSIGTNQSIGNNQR